MPNTLEKPLEHPRRQSSSHETSGLDTPITTASFPTHRNTASVIFGFSSALAIFGICSGRVSLWDLDGVILASSMKDSLILSAVLVLVAGMFFIRSRRVSPSAFTTGAALGLLCFFFSDWTIRNYSLLKGPSIRGEILLGAGASFLLLRSLGAYRLALLALPSSLLVLFYNFATTVQHRLILGDDHSVFLHRLSLLRENFPQIPTFDASWNGGLDSLHLFATGVLNVFFLYAPLVYGLGVENSYNVIIALSLFALVPLCSYCAARYFDLSPAVACLSAVLSLSQGLFFYRWGLVYGTLGFFTACALLPFVFSLFYRFIHQPERFTRIDALLLFASCSLMLCWPLSGVPFVVVAAALLLKIGSVLRNKRFFIACLSIALITAPWVFVLWSGWNVKGFITAKKPSFHDSIEGQQSADAAPATITKETTPAKKFTGTVFRAKKRELGVAEAVRIIRDQTSPDNPLLLVLFLPGVLLLPATARWLFLGTGSWLLAVACIGGPIKPQLELERMLVMFACLQAVPAALALYSLWSYAHTSVRDRFSLRLLVASLAGGFLFAGVLSTAASIANRRLDKVHFAEQSFYDLAAAIDQNARNGRAVFSGFTLHELNQGHLAPLTHFARTPMVASSHVHNVWQYKDVIPESYRQQGAFGIETYLDLWNASVVVAHDPVWRRYFRSQSARYTEVGTYDRFVVFRREPFPDTYFSSGSGEIISQSTSGLRLALNSPEAVLKFRYNNNLVVRGCAEIFPQEVTEDLSFISLAGCEQGQVIEIKSKSFFGRISEAALHFLGRFIGNSTV